MIMLCGLALLSRPLGSQAAGDPTTDQGGADLSAIRERIVTLHRFRSRGRGAAADTGGRLRCELGQGVRNHVPP